MVIALWNVARRLHSDYDAPQAPTATAAPHCTAGDSQARDIVQCTPWPFLQCCCRRHDDAVNATQHSSRKSSNTAPARHPQQRQYVAKPLLIMVLLLQLLLAAAAVPVLAPQPIPAASSADQCAPPSVLPPPTRTPAVRLQTASSARPCPQHRPRLRLRQHSTWLQLQL